MSLVHAFARAAVAATIITAPWIEASAQSPGAWPNHPIRILHGYDNGSNPDTLARLIGPALGERLGQPIIVEPKPGAGGRIATTYAATQPADGYTFMMLTAGDTVVAATDTKLKYNLLTDFAFTTQITQFPFIYITSASSPYMSLREALDVAKREPGKLTFATPGISTTQHLAGELLNSLAGVELRHIPFKGNAIGDLIGGRLDLLLAAPAVATPQIKSGRVRALAVTGITRMSAYPDVPAVAELAPGYDVTSWLGLAAPAKTDPAIVARMAAEVRRVIADDTIRARLLATGADVTGTSPEAFRARVEADVAKWKRVAAGLSLN